MMKVILLLCLALTSISAVKTLEEITSLQQGELVEHAETLEALHAEVANQGSSDEASEMLKAITANIKAKIANNKAQLESFKHVNEAEVARLKKNKKRSEHKRSVNRSTVKALQPRVKALKAKLARAEVKAAPVEAQWRNIQNQILRLKSRRDNAIRRLNIKIRDQKHVVRSLEATINALKALSEQGKTDPKALLEMPINEAYSFLALSEDVLASEENAEESDAELLGEESLSAEDEQELLQETSEEEEQEEESEEESEEEEDNSAEDAAEEAEEAAEEAIAIAEQAEEENLADDAASFVEEDNLGVEHRYLQVAADVAASGNSIQAAIESASQLREQALQAVVELKADKAAVLKRFEDELKIATKKADNLAPFTKNYVEKRDAIKAQVEKLQSTVALLKSKNAAARANEKLIDKQIATVTKHTQQETERVAKANERLGAQLNTVSNLKGSISKVVAENGPLHLGEASKLPAHWQAAKWSKCSRPCGKGIRTRTVRCVSFSNTPVPAARCNQVRPKSVKKCVVKACPANCQVSKWGKWGKCKAEDSCHPNDKEVVGFQKRTRSIVSPAKAGGKKCPRLVEQKKCAKPCTKKAIKKAVAVKKEKQTKQGKTKALHAKAKINASHQKAVAAKAHAQAAKLKAKALKKKAAAAQKKADEALKNAKTPADLEKAKKLQADADKLKKKHAAAHDVHVQAKIKAIKAERKANKVAKEHKRRAAEHAKKTAKAAEKAKKQAAGKKQAAKAAKAKAAAAQKHADELLKNAKTPAEVAKAKAAQKKAQKLRAKADRLKREYRAAKTAAIHKEHEAKVAAKTHKKIAKHVAEKKQQKAAAKAAPKSSGKVASKSSKV